MKIRRYLPAEGGNFGKQHGAPSSTEVCGELQQLWKTLLSRIHPAPARTFSPWLGLVFFVVCLVRWSSAAYACHRMLDLSDKVGPGVT